MTIRAVNQWLPPTYTRDFASEQSAWAQNIIDALSAVLQTADFARGARFWLRQLSTGVRELKYSLDARQRNEILDLLWRLLWAFPEDLKFQEQVMDPCITLLRMHREVHPGFDIEWRKLYLLLRERHLRKTITVDSYTIAMANHCRELVQFISTIRRYFAPEAFDEIRSEFSQQLFVTNPYCFRAQALLCTFLPDLVVDRNDNRISMARQIDTAFVEQCLASWEWFEKSSFWDSNWAGLLARIAKADTQHRIEWNRMNARIFTHILRMLDVAVVDGRVPKSKDTPIEDQAFALVTNRHVYQNIARWIIYTIPTEARQQSDDDAANDPLQQLNSLLQVLESYFHPYNIGSWTSNLAVFINSLASSLAKRVREHNRVAEGLLVESAHAISLEQQQAIVRVLLPAVSQSLFSKHGQMQSLATDAFKHLAWISPDTALPHVLERVREGLESSSATRQTLNAIEILAAVVPVMLCLSDRYPEGREQLMSLLFATLPGIDVNDDAKTFATFKVHFAVLACGVPFFDDGYGSLDTSCLTPEQRTALAASSSFADWVVQFLDRIWQLLQAQDKPEEDRSQQQHLSEQLFQKLMIAFFAQLSPQLFTSSFERLAGRLCAEALPNALRSIYVIFAGAAAARPQQVLRRLLSLVRTSVLDRQSTLEEPKINSHTSSSTIEWLLAALSGAVAYGGPALSDHQHSLSEIVLACASDESNAVADAAGQLLHVLLDALTVPRISEYRSMVIPDEHAAAPDEYLAQNHFRVWSTLPSRSELKAQWFEPSHEKHWRSAVEIADRVIDTARRTIDELVLQSDSLSSKQRRSLWRAMSLLQKVAAGGVQLLHSNALPDGALDLDDAVIPFEPREWEYAIQRSPIYVRPQAFQSEQQQQENRRRKSQLVRLLHRVAHYLIRMRSDDSASMVRWCNAVHPVLVMGSLVRGQEPPSSKPDGVGQFRRLYYLFKNKWHISIGARSKAPRVLQLWRAEMQYHARLEESLFEQPYTTSIKELIDDVHAMSLGPYSDVRKAAQPILLDACKRFPKRWHDTITELISGVLECKDEYRVNGYIFTLLSSPIMARIVRDWRYIPRFLGSVCRAYEHERPEVQTRIYHLFLFFCMKFHGTPLATPLPLAPGARDRLVLDHTLVAKATEKRQRDNDKNRKAFQGVIDTLLEILHVPSLHWRYKVMCSASLLLLFYPGHIPDKRVVKWFLDNTASDLASVRFLSIICVPRLVEAVRDQASRRCASQTPAFFPHGATAPESEAEWQALDGKFSDSLATGWRDELPTPHRHNIVGSDEEGGTSNAHAHETLAEIAVMFEEFCSNSAHLSKTFALLVEDHVVPSDDQRAFGGAGSLPSLLASFSSPNLASQVARAASALRSVGAQYVQQAAEDLLQHLAKPNKKWPVLTEQRVSEVFSLANAWFVTSLCYRIQGARASDSDPLLQRHQEALQTSLRPILEQYLRGETRQEQSTAAEIMCGLVHGSSRAWSYGARERLVQWIRPLLQSVVEGGTISDQASNDWAAAIQFMAYKRDPRRLKWLLDLTISAPLLGTSTSAVQAKRLVYARVLSFELGWRLARMQHAATQDSVARHIVEVLLSHLAHPYKQVRLAVAISLAEQLMLSWQEPSTDDAPSSERSALFALFVAKIVERSSTWTTVATVRDDPETLERSRFRETVVVALHYLLTQNRVTDLLPHLPQLLRFIFHSLVDIDEETAKTARACFVLIAQLGIPRVFMGRYLEVLKELLVHENWRLRVAAIAFFQIATFVNRFQLTEQERKDIHDAIIERLRDREVEARELAAGALSSLLRGQSEEYVLSVAERCKTMAAQSLRLHKRAAESAEEFAERHSRAFVRRHAGVLGISAVIGLHPYDVPAWLPDLLALLASHGHDTSPIDTTVRKTIQEFGRTHQDEWQNNKFIWFTPEQLEALDTVLGTPTYLV